MDDFFFENFNYIILMITVFFCILTYFLNRKDISKIYNSKVLFFLVFLFVTYWIPQGFDLTDEGFILSKSWFMLHGMWHENIDMIWGSSLVNGLWLSIMGTPNVLWARVGFSLLYALITIVSFKIIIIFFSQKESFWVVLLLSILVPVGHTQTINYHNLPTLFVLMSFLFFINAFKKRYIFNFILAGIFIVISVVMRFPLIVLVSYPFFFFFLDDLINKVHFRISIKNLFYTYIGVLIGFILILSFLFLTDSLKEYYNSIFKKFDDIENINPNHSISYLFKVYKNDIRLIIIRSLFSIAYIITISLLVRHIKNKTLKFSSLMLFSLGILYFALKVQVYHNWMYTIMGFEFSAIIIFLFFNFKDIKKYYALSFFSLFLFLISYIGSDMGFRIHIWSGAMIFFAAVFILLLHSTDFKLNQYRYNFRYIIIIFFSFLALLSFRLKPKSIYRDQPRKELTQMFKANELEGIKSHARRVEVFDSLMTYTKGNFKKQDEIMVVGTMQMIYYLLNKK